MADLSTISTSSPADGDLIAQGDDTIRETRDAMVTSFGGVSSGSGAVLAEHYLKGFHKFPYGTAAARPAAGNAGRIYLNTEHEWIELDNGATFAQLHAVASTHTSTTTPVVLTGTDQTLISTSVVTRANSNVIIIANLTFTETSGTSSANAGPSFTWDGAAVVSPTIHLSNIPASASQSLIFMGVVTSGITDGSHTLVCQAIVYSGAALTFTRGNLLALVM